MTSVLEDLQWLKVSVLTVVSEVGAWPSTNPPLTSCPIHPHILIHPQLASLIILQHMGAGSPSEPWKLLFFCV